MKKYDYGQYFSVKDLQNMIVTQYNPTVKDSKYYINQLFVMDMFIRLNNVWRTVVLFNPGNQFAIERI
jgi:hypothetical protein